MIHNLLSLVHSDRLTLYIICATISESLAHECDMKHDFFSVWEPNVKEQKHALNFAAQVNLHSGDNDNAGFKKRIRRVLKLSETLIL